MTETLIDLGLLFLDFLNLTIILLTLPKAKK